MVYRFCVLLLLFLAAACQQTPAVTPAPTAIPLPTMTVGQTVRGALSEVQAQPVDGSGLSNPATAVALASQPTATPDYATCPAPADVTPGEAPTSEQDVIRAITGFLNQGGSVARLEATLRDEWSLLGEGGFVRGDLDLTGEGQPEVIVGYTTPENFGTLLIWGCVDGQYTPAYQAIADTDAPPEIVQATDMNFDQQTDLLLSNEQCDDDGRCSYLTQLITWKRDLGRYVNLIEATISGDNPPELRDIDEDNVLEIVVRLTNPGNAETGPLRTGVNIYDWNGSVYTLSIVQPDPLRFTIQMIHEADNAFDQMDMTKAVTLYQQALNDPALEPWFNDDPTILRGYAMYRLLLAYAYTEDAQLLDMVQRIMQEYPDAENRPIYVDMSESFWNAHQVTNNLHSACLEVLDIVNAHPESLALLNRYGSRSPTYLPQDLCPF